MELHEKPLAELLGAVLKNSTEVRRKLSFCCNVGMEDRDAQIKKLDNVNKLLVLLARREEIFDLIWKGKELVIYFDMDGIVADWRGHMLSHYPQFGHIDEFNKHPEKAKMTTAAYQHEPNFFKNLPPMEHGMDMLCLLISKGFNVKILSAIDSTGNEAHIRRDKFEFLQNELLKRGILKVPDCVFVDQSANKEHYADPAAILIDDYHVNIEAWRAAGGIGIYVNTEDKEEELAWKSADFILRSIVTEKQRYDMYKYGVNQKTKQDYS